MGDIEIVELVSINHETGYVVSRMPELTYERHGNLLIGSDETQTFFDVLEYEWPFGMYKAFGGREFDLYMKDGTTTHCNGQWWSGGSSKAADILGITFAGFTHSTVERLKKCYVFFSGIADKKKLCALVTDFQTNNENKKVWEYLEYEKAIREVAE